MAQTVSHVKKDLRSFANPEKVHIYQNFFKTGKGEYGEGDKFLGITMPNIRTVARKYHEIEFDHLKKLLQSPFHEDRMCAIVMLTLQFEKGNKTKKKKIYTYYLSNIKKSLNNWDFVDVSAPKIVGEYLLDKDRKVLYKLAQSKNLWEKRVSIIATARFIRESDFTDTISFSEILLHDKHDLIHKAVGWMLREVGKEDIKILEKFLKKYYKEMPRTMLRYAIEKFPEKRRKAYLKGQV